MFASPYFNTARDWTEISVRAHQFLTQTAPDDDLIDEIAVPEPAPEELREVA